MSTPIIKTYYPFFDPSLAGAVIFASLYTITLIATVALWIRYRAWVWFVMVLAALMEATGYIFRIISVKNPHGRSIYIVQFCLIILAPVMMAAALYIIFGRIVFHVLPPSARRARVLWVPPRFVTLIFVLCDILAFFVQLIGAVIVAGTQITDHNAKQKLNKGKNIVLTGLALQIACFGLFSIIAARFHFTSKRYVKEFDRRVGGESSDKWITIDSQPRRLRRDWGTLLLVVNIACTLILVRSVYRVADFSMGKGGYMEHHEYFFYILDALPILPCVSLFVWFHPAKYLPYLGWRLPAHIRGRPGDYNGAGGEPLRVRNTLEGSETYK